MGGQRISAVILSFFFVISEIPAQEYVSPQSFFCRDILKRAFDYEFSQYKKLISFRYASPPEVYGRFSRALFLADSNSAYSVAPRVAKAYPEMQVIQSDISISGTGTANHGSLRLIRLDNSEPLPFADNSFDVIVMRSGLCACATESPNTCGGIEKTEEGFMRFFVEVGRVLDKRNPASVAYLEGSHSLSGLVEKVADRMMKEVPSLDVVPILRSLKYFSGSVRISPRNPNHKSPGNLEAQQGIKLAGLEKDPDFEKKVAAWLLDTSKPFAMKRVLLPRWLDGGGDLPALIRPLTTQEKVEFIQNVLDTPSLMDRVLKNKEQLPDLMVQVRENKKLFTPLLEAYAKHSADLILKVLKRRDLTEAQSAGIIRKIGENIPTQTQNLADAAEPLLFAAGTAFEPKLTAVLKQAYLRNTMNSLRFAREVRENLGHKSPLIRKFASEILKIRSKNADLPIFRTIREVETISQSKGISQGEAERLWLSDETRSPELKGEYLRMHVTSPEYERLEDLVPKSMRETVRTEISKYTNALEFRKLAKEQGISLEEFSNYIPESFERVSFIFPKEGKTVTLGSPQGEEGRRNYESDEKPITFKKGFSLHATSVTNAQYRIYLEATAKNPKMLSELKKKDPNEPVVNVNWYEARAYAEWLSGIARRKYFLPTETQREFATRAGTTTRYWSGDSIEALLEVAWVKENSEGKIHPVAQKRANPCGLYDMHGNNYDWTDGETSYEFGHLPVERGGAWFHSAESARSAYRDPIDPNPRHPAVGFRLASEP